MDYEEDFMMFIKRATQLVVLSSFVSLSLFGCASKDYVLPNGLATQDVDPTTRGPVSGIGVEHNDIANMASQMTRDLLSNATIANAQKPPRIIVDESEFTNSSTQIINLRLITNKLRTELNRAANGRMVFINRANIARVQAERDLKRQGVTDIGTTGLTKAPLAADYVLVAELASQNTRNAKGMMQRYTQITFEMMDVETSELVWSNSYDFTRASMDDVSYR